MSKKIALAAALAAAFSSNTAFALTATTTMPVSATITGACTVSATTLAFGNIVTIIGVDTDQTATISVDCTTGLAYNIAVDDGANQGAGTHNRNMISPATVKLQYQVYTDAARTTVVDSVGAANTGFTAATGTYGTGFGSAQVVTVYGRVLQQVTSPAADTFTDTLGVTVTY